MAPRKKVSTASQGPGSALPEPSTDATVLDREPVKVQLYDGTGMKGALDDLAREVVTDAGFEEDTTTSNVKIGVGLIAIGCALYAQFGPGKFPANWWPVLFCVVAYTALSAWLNWWLHKHEGDAFLICKPRRGTKQGLRMSSRMERFDDKYTLVIAQGRPGEPGHRDVKFTASVAKFFHADGYLSEAAFRPQVEQLLTEFESAIKTQ